MINTRRWGPLFFILCLGATPLLAQPEATGGEGSSSAAAASGSADTTAPTPPATAPTSSSSGTGSKSPFDYRSSEEISEDVPVSFPVDI
jgi:hypothetical protein